MQQYTVCTPLSNKLRIITKTKVKLLLENYHIMNSALSICNVVRLAQYTEFHSVPSVLTDMSAVTSFQTESNDMVKLHDMSVALLHQHVNKTCPGPLFHVNMT